MIKSCSKAKKLHMDLKFYNEDKSSLSKYVPQYVKRRSTELPTPIFQLANRTFVQLPIMSHANVKNYMKNFLKYFHHASLHLHRFDNQIHETPLFNTYLNIILRLEALPALLTLLHDLLHLCKQAKFLNMDIEITIQSKT